MSDCDWNSDSVILQAVWNSRTAPSLHQAGRLMTRRGGRRRRTNSDWVWIWPMFPITYFRLCRNQPINHFELNRTVHLETKASTVFVYFEYFWSHDWTLKLVRTSSVFMEKLCCSEGTINLPIVLTDLRSKKAFGKQQKKKKTLECASTKIGCQLGAMLL